MNNLSFVLIRPLPPECDETLWNRLFHEWILRLKPEFAGEIEVSFVSRNRMRAYYKQAYGEDRPTDVLSLRHAPQAGITKSLVGEIVICPAVARVDAKKLKSDVQTELATLFVHGLLHLMDMTHDDTSEQHRFHELTHDIMATQSLKALSLW